MKKRHASAYFRQPASDTRRYLCPAAWLTGMGLLQAEQADYIHLTRQVYDMCEIPLGWGIAFLADALKDTNCVCNFELQDSRPGGNPGTKPKLAGGGAVLLVRLTRNNSGKKVRIHCSLSRKDRVTHVLGCPKLCSTRNRTKLLLRILVPAHIIKLTSLLEPHTSDSTHNINTLTAGRTQKLSTLQLQPRTNTER